MKLEKISIDGKKDTIEVLDKIFSAKINSKLVSSVLYKTNAIIKADMQKPNSKTKLAVQPLKFMLKKVLVEQDMLVEKLQFLLVVV